MSPQGFETHRCKGSLKARCSIRRYPAMYDHRRPYNLHDGEWHLYELYVDLDWDYTGMREVAAINVCLWCGRDLYAKYPRGVELPKALEL